MTLTNLEKKELIDDYYVQDLESILIEKNNSSKKFILKVK